MATVNTFSSVKQMIELNSEYPGSVVYRAYEYWSTLAEGIRYAVFSVGQYDNLNLSPYVKWRKLLYNHGAWTDRGKELLSDHERREGHTHGNQDVHQQVESKEPADSD